MRITWDSQAEAAYIYFKENTLAAKTIELKQDEILLDIDEIGEPIGIEVLRLDIKPFIKDITKTRKRKWQNRLI